MSFEPETEVIELESRLGRVGSIQAFDLWQGRESLDACYEQVATIAGISHANEHPKNPKGLFDHLVNAKPVMHGEPLESIPFIPGKLRYGGYESIRAASLRHNMSALGFTKSWSKEQVEVGRSLFPAHAYRIEMPQVIYIHWLRHGAFGKNVMSRRKVPDSKVPVRFYGEEWALDNDPVRHILWNTQKIEYHRRLDRGEPLELARTVFGTDQFMEFWSWGFDKDYELGSGFNLQRVADPHAMAEIRVFAQWIESYLSGKNSDAK